MKLPVNKLWWIMFSADIQSYKFIYTYIVYISCQIAWHVQYLKQIVHWPIGKMFSFRSVVGHKFKFTMYVYVCMFIRVNHSEA